MSKGVMKSSKAKENFFHSLKAVNEEHSEIQIISERNENDAVLISKKELGFYTGNFTSGTDRHFRRSS